LPLFGLLTVFLPDLGSPTCEKCSPIIVPHPAMEQTDP
jgi:hypothetical protein